jgi:Uma2 family endonuclease
MSTRVKLTYEDYLATPETNLPCEVVDGELFMSAAPNVPHQVVVGNIYRPLYIFVASRRLGMVYVAPIDLVLDKARPLVLQPDVCFVSVARMAIVGERIEGPPDLVIEVLSAGTGDRDRGRKLGWYARYGVQEAWLVDLDSRVIEVYRLAAGGCELRGTYRPGDSLSSEVLPGFALDPAEAFAGL